MKYYNKTNKNNYILFSGELNSRIGKAEMNSIVGSFGELVQTPEDKN